MEKTDETFHFQASLDVYDDNLYAYHFKVPDAISAHFLQEKRTRIIATFANQITLHLALMPSGNERFLMINQPTRKKLKIEVGDIIDVSLKHDTSKYGVPMPVEFEQTLMQDEKAYQLFEGLTPGKQRTLIHLVLSVKNETSRIRRSLAIAEHILESAGKLDFKRLNELIKFYNKHR